MSFQHQLIDIKISQIRIHNGCIVTRVRDKVGYKAADRPDAMVPVGAMRQRPGKQERHTTGDKSADVVKSREMVAIGVLLHYRRLAVQFQIGVDRRERERYV